ncbi:MAG: hypothetical protein HYV62_13220 [Candidatus Rokubacteria bacterium]|nr:hypothetical protein [Candidatus Rokubacteria bacterium]
MTAVGTLCVTLVPLPVAAEITLGLTGGVAFVGEQDLKLVEGGADRETVSLTERRGVEPSPGPLGGVTLTLWGTPWPWLGLQLDGLYWTTAASTAGTTPDARLTVDQTRTALLLSVLGRLPLDEGRGAFAYGGLGGGVIWSRVNPGGEEDLGAGVGLVGGVAVAVGPRVRLRVEVRYLVAPDVDARRRAGVQAETSGSSDGNPAHALFGPHLDTQFIPLLVGLDWVF